MATDNEQTTDSDIDAQAFFSPYRASDLLRAVWEDVAGPDHTTAVDLVEAQERFLRDLWKHTTASLILNACGGDVRLVARWVGLPVGLDDIVTLAHAGIEPEQLSRSVLIDGESRLLAEHISWLLKVLPDHKRARAIFLDASSPASPHHNCGGTWSDEGLGWAIN